MWELVVDKKFPFTTKYFSMYFSKKKNILLLRLQREGPLDWRLSAEIIKHWAVVIFTWLRSPSQPHPAYFPFYLYYSPWFYNVNNQTISRLLSLRLALSSHTGSNLKSSNLRILQCRNYLAASETTGEI